MYFKLRNVDFEVTNSRVKLEKRENGIYMSIEVVAATEDKSIDFEMREIEVTIDGFNTNVQDIKELENKRFVWDGQVNENNEEAGVFNVVEFEDVTKGTIEIKRIENNNITIHWFGTGNIFWSSDFQDNVPFNTEFTTEIIIKQ